ncbi:ankyrin repeat domain-containing protein [Legionella sp. PATHC035]|uniref:hypothetical protein n=1 Tax=Legionella sp. PATHC035 TaxID=2992040 RepID=UPI0022445519|nr:hypothetical protein [Legionella sp. PATHC035]MCW8409614.1 ankyrin repeat domain-containing protein [Legionella sp. PATHC035]
MGKSVKELLNAIEALKYQKEIGEQLKKIEELANKVLEKHHTLNLVQEDALRKTPLEAAIFAASLPAFQLLLGLGADLFFKSKPDMMSAIDILAYMSLRLPYTSKKPLFEWIMTAKESPVFNWTRLNDNPTLFAAFQQAGLIPQKPTLNELPIHVAIQAGQIDLIQQVVKAAGSIQKAGDFCQMSILKPAILAVLKGQKHSLAILRYLLQQGASNQTWDTNNLPALMQAILTENPAHFYDGNQEAVVDIVNLLFEYGATLDVTEPTKNNTPLMSAMERGHKNLFYCLLEKADAKVLNHCAALPPHYLIFQLFNKFANRLRRIDVLKLLAELKEKGLEFDKTIDCSYQIDPFNEKSLSETRAVSAQNMSVLHYYIQNMKISTDDPLESMDEHLKIIQALIAHGVNFKTKATFTLTPNVMTADSGAQKVQSRMELTASEYARKIAYHILNHYHASLIKEHQDENAFLRDITDQSREEQTRLHKIFHQFRNLERVLSGEKSLPYCGLPNIKKREQCALQKPKAESKPIPALYQLVLEADFEPTRFKSLLINARTQHIHSSWQALKTSLVDYVKETDSLQDFLARLEQFKESLQLHFNVTTNSKGEVIYGSRIYRFFHYFDPHKFPNSWETLRKYGQETYGIDINTPYDGVSTDLKMN